MKLLLKEFGPGGFLIALMLVMSLIYGNGLPDQVPVHFDIAGNPDRWEAREVFVYMLPLVMAGAMVGVSVLLRLSPKLWSMPNARGILGMMYFGSAALIAGIHIGILLDPEVGALFRTCFTAATALFLVVVGNLLGKSEKNFFLGIRLPWTLASDNNWSATHRFTGRLMVLAGVVVGFAAFLAPGMALVIGAIVLPLLAGGLYSFVYYWTRERNLEDV